MPARPTSRRRLHLLHFLPILLFAALYAITSWIWGVPLWVGGLYIGMSALTFITYAIDKSSAQRGGRRISEGMLNLLAFLGGWPGAIVAQQTLRHKAVKASFRARFWMAVVANILLFVMLASPLLGLAGARI